MTGRQGGQVPRPEPLRASGAVASAHLCPPPGITENPLPQTLLLTRQIYWTEKWFWDATNMSVIPVFLLKMHIKCHFFKYISLIQEGMVSIKRSARAGILVLFLLWTAVSFDDWWWC